ncbi:hypothetical protein WOLCODRAFT_157446 [Wolfiporia cocos MD-104 SS10]|uniref:Uncharacterized protein n=1 Tax=Wolfiporia cocos (strain MD-104) TaxID=742152 RepID=A0A2H3J442_WOLCO|nr:hypothetical protein WOLCODRAFT_157446 [Wolfiporia cocos MD-104 SS10]
MSLCDSFFIYCEEFRQLAKLTGYENASLRKKLEDTLPADLKKQFGVFESMGMGFKAPEEWEDEKKKEEPKKKDAPAKAPTTTSATKPKEDPAMKPIPSDAPKGLKWVKNRFGKVNLWEGKCKWDAAKVRPKADKPKGAQQSNSGNPPAYQQQGKGRFVKVTTMETWIPATEDETVDNFSVQSSTCIEEVEDQRPEISTPEKSNAPIGKPPNWGTTYILWQLIAQTEPKRPASSPGFPLQHM